MKTHHGWIVLAAFAAMPAWALDAAVGNGTPVSCGEFAFEQALASVQSSGGGTVSFNCGPAPHIIVLSSRKNLLAGTIVDGANLITLSGLNASGLLRIPDGQASVELRRLSLTQGRSVADFGAAIQLGANSTLRLIDSEITQCVADFSGGAIHALAGSTLHIEDSFLAQNQAGNGGAIAANGSVTLIDSVIAGNLAAQDQGGGVQIWFGQLHAQGTRFSVNSAINGGALLLRGTVASITDSSFDENTASERGGAIALYENAAMQGSQLRFDRNHGLLGGALHLGGTDQGIPGEPVPEAQVVLLHSVFEQNDADLGGAVMLEGPNPTNAGSYGLLHATDSAFVGNAARLDGGAIHSYGQTRFSRTHFTANRAENGGALALGNPWIESLAFQWGFTALESVRFDSNQALLEGGAIFGGGVPVMNQVHFQNNRADSKGGAIAVRSTMPALTQASFIGNSAGVYGGAMYIQGADQALLNLTFFENQVDPGGRGSDILVYGDRFTISSSVQLTHCTLLGTDPDGAEALGISLFGAQARLKNSIVSAVPGELACGPNLVSEGGNALSADCTPAAPDDWVIMDSADLLLDPISNAGALSAGLVPTVGSALIDAVDCPANRNLDQRGISAPQDGDSNGEARCDIGAIERRPNEPDAIYATFRNGFE